jgi:hypothetical protein
LYFAGLQAVLAGGATWRHAWPNLPAHPADNGVIIEVHSSTEEITMLRAAPLAAAVVFCPVLVVSLLAQEPAPTIDATKQETWTLGDQQWDFKDIATAYQPVKGTLNPKTGAAIWTLEIVKDLAPGEVGTQENIEGSPFKLMLLDDEKIAVPGKPRVKLETKITGKMGDKIKIAVQLPMADVLGKVRLVRVERRTKIGF